MIVAAIETIMFTSASGGELTATIVRIAMPAAIAIGAAAIGVTNASSATVVPNQVHRSADQRQIDAQQAEDRVRGKAKPAAGQQQARRPQCPGS